MAGTVETTDPTAEDGVRSRLVQPPGFRDGGLGGLLRTHTELSRVRAWLGRGQGLKDQTQAHKRGPSSWGRLIARRASRTQTRLSGRRPGC